MPAESLAQLRFVVQPELGQSKPRLSAYGYVRPAPYIFPCLAPSIAHLPPVVLFLGTRISSFSQADLASRSIRYVHTSDVEKHADAFTFSVSDGTNEVSPGTVFLRAVHSVGCDGSRFSSWVLAGDSYT